MNTSDRQTVLSRHAVLAALMRHIGAQHGVTATALVREVTGAPARDSAAERQLREIVVSLRLDGHHVCADPQHGYFIAASSGELNTTCRFLYARAMTSLQQVAAMKRVSLPDLEGQLRLRT